MFLKVHNLGVIWSLTSCLYGTYGKLPRIMTVYLGSSLHQRNLLKSHILVIFLGPSSLMPHHLKSEPSYNTPKNPKKTNNNKMNDIHELVRDGNKTVCHNGERMYTFERTFYFSSWQCWGKTKRTSEFTRRVRSISCFNVYSVSLHMYYFTCTKLNWGGV